MRSAFPNFGRQSPVPAPSSLWLGQTSAQHANDHLRGPLTVLRRCESEQIHGTPQSSESSRRHWTDASRHPRSGRRHSAPVWADLTTDVGAVAPMPSKAIGCVQAVDPILSAGLPHKTMIVAVATHRRQKRRLVTPWGLGDRNLHGPLFAPHVIPASLPRFVMPGLFDTAMTCVKDGVLWRNAAHERAECGQHREHRPTRASRRVHPAESTP